MSCVVKSRLTTHTDEVWDVQFSHNGAMFASASKDATAIIWGIPKDTGWNGGGGGGGSGGGGGTAYGQPAVLHILVGHTDAISFLAWSPDDTMLLTGGHNVDDGTVRIWHTSTGAALRTIHTPKGVSACAWAPDGRCFAVGGVHECVSLWSTDKSEKMLRSWPSVFTAGGGMGYGGRLTLIENTPKGRGRVGWRSPAAHRTVCCALSSLHKYSAIPFMLTSANSDDVMTRQVYSRRGDACRCWRSGSRNLEHGQCWRQLVAPAQNIEGVFHHCFVFNVAGWYRGLAVHGVTGASPVGSSIAEAYLHLRRILPRPLRNRSMLGRRRRWASVKRKLERQRSHLEQTISENDHDPKRTFSNRQRCLLVSERFGPFRVRKRRSRRQLMGH